jgi:hypothetical protein
MGQKSEKTSSIAALEPRVVYVLDGAAAKLASGWIDDML